MTYTDSVKAWQCKGELQKRLQLIDREVKNKKLIEVEVDSRLPVRDVQCPEHLATFFAGCAQAWAEQKCVPMEELLHVYWIDLTIPGFNYNRSLLQALTTLSAALTASPESSAGIILAPNCGPFGMEYTDAGVRKSLVAIPPLLGDSELNLVYRDITLAFDPATIPKKSNRQGKAEGWMVMSALASAAGVLRSLFEDSELWI